MWMWITSGRTQEVIGTDVCSSDLLGKFYHYIQAIRYESSVESFVKIDSLQDYVPELVVGFIEMHRISANRIWKQSTVVTYGYKT